MEDSQSSPDSWLEHFSSHFELLNKAFGGISQAVEARDTDMPEPVDISVPEGEVIIDQGFSIASRAEQPVAAGLKEENNPASWAVAAETDCSEEASKGLGCCSLYQLSYGSGKCLGKCCASEGKCSSDSCAANGLGKDVALMPCYGLNSEAKLSLVLGKPCANLACKLHVPGCKDDKELLGTGTGSGTGSCVGEVMSLAGGQQLNPIGKQLLGYPCLSSMVGRALHGDMQQPVDEDGEPQEYINGAWKVCYSSEMLQAGSEDESSVIELDVVQSG